MRVLVYDVIRGMSVTMSLLGIRVRKWGSMRKAMQSESNISPMIRLLIAIVIITVGFYMCARGVSGLIGGENTQAWGSEHGDVFYKETFTGTLGACYSIAEIAFGTSIIPLSFLAPGALDARALRGSFFALPKWQGGTLIVSLIMLGGSILFLGFGPFF